MPTTVSFVIVVGIPALLLLWLAATALAVSGRRRRPDAPRRRPRFTGENSPVDPRAKIR